MSSERDTEVVGCDASIMKNVWEIRGREQGHKQQQEEERLRKSAMPSINKEWANRVAARNGTYKRVEKKPKSVEKKIDNESFWKSGGSLVPSTSPRSTGSSPLGRPGQSRGYSTSVYNYKYKKGQDKNVQKLQLLLSITQTEPSTMVWGKSWKHNKSLPLLAEGTEAGWGPCWMFATQQPYSEPGKPWLNGPNMVRPHSLHVWEKMNSRLVESQEIVQIHPPEEWQMSWRKSQKNNKKNVNVENVHKSVFSTLLETQHQNEALCSSEWNESWTTIKPAIEEDHFTVPNDQMEDKEVSSAWENCWMLVNQHGFKKSTMPQVKKLQCQEWADSWRAAMVLNNIKNSNASLRQGPSDTYDDCHQQRELYLHKCILLSERQKYRDLYLEFSNECKAFSEWNLSWQVIKNNSKPSEEMEKFLKASPQIMENALVAEKVEKKAKGKYSTSEKADYYYEQLRNNVLYCPNRDFTQSSLKHLRNVFSASEWKDSWKILKHRMRMERRRMRPNPSRPFKVSANGEDMKPSTPEWRESWKFTSPPICQEPQLWQQGWSSMPHIRVARMMDQIHFDPIELPPNGPTRERCWRESWRSSRHQPQSQSGQGRASYHPDESRTQRRNTRSVSDWQVAWMVSETQFHHDRPSLTQWREAWMCSHIDTERLIEPMPIENCVEDLMEIQPQREIMSLHWSKNKMSSSFDNQIFRVRYPEKQWNVSWRATSLLDYQQSHALSEMPGKNMSSTNQHQHATKWGLSFRVANTMPHMEKPWVRSSPNLCHYPVMWSRKNKKETNITSFINNPTTFKLWMTSHLFLQMGKSQIKGNTKAPVDPRVIFTKKNKPRKHLYNLKQEKQSEKRWAGCHLLGKTQPRPKKGIASVETLKMEDTDKVREEWAESWRFLEKPGNLKYQMPVMSHWRWVESWKFLLPPYQTMNGPKAK